MIGAIEELSPKTSIKLTLREIQDAAPRVE